MLTERFPLLFTVPIGILYVSQTTTSSRILPLQQLGNSGQLDVAGALVDDADLRIAEVLLSEALTNEAHAAHPLHAQAADAAGHLRRVELGHGRVLDEVLAGLLLTRRIVH